ncbi:SKP1 [Melia azedarach]|uniref:SKP1 n=1 Tax=Melia azedarach TaxID=155640 RepID=A0ACC1YPR9_MELAZ|nr:SKP1 [Melia azedarach]
MASDSMASSSKNPRMESSSSNPIKTISLTTSDGQPIKTISLTTSDGQLFTVEESVALEFGTVKSFFEDNSDAVEDAVIPLPNVSGDVLTKVIIYCRKHLEFRKHSTPKEEVKSFNRGFVQDESTDMIMEIVLAANYLNVKDLLELMEDTVADRIKNKSVEYVRELFGIANDFTPEEEESIRKEYAWAFEGVDKDN